MGIVFTAEQAVRAESSQLAFVHILLILGVIALIGVIIAVIAAISSKKEILTEAGEGSYFDGSTWQLIGYRILSGFICAITLGITYPWMLCMVQGWEVKHTVINGRRLKFNGHGHQLIGKYILWVFLTIITFGIYGIWLGLGMKKWVVKHTVYADEKKPVDSYFSGGAGGYLGIHLLAVFLTLFTFGLGKPWADKMVLSWEAKHTHIGGSPLTFNGTGGQLFGKYLLLILLTPLTLGIYALFFTVIYMKWQVKHTEAVYQTPEIQAKARAHEATAIQDYARFRIAANDQELAAIKSGYTGKEDAETLEQMAGDGNPFAAYHLAKQLKGDNKLYEGRALELLQIAAAGKHHNAMFDLSKQTPSEQSTALLTEAAQGGNAEASWLLSIRYRNAHDLAHAAYWFKVALEWGWPAAQDHAGDYPELVKQIALQLSEKHAAGTQNKALAIVLGVVAAVIMLIVMTVIPAIFGLKLFGSAKVAEGPVHEIVYLDTVDIDSIQGKTYSMDDAEGNEIQYIMDESVFFDEEDRVLYIHFGLIDYDEQVYLRMNNGWHTQTILPGNGITKVQYPFVLAPSTIEVWCKFDEFDGYFINRHHLDAEEGNSKEAEAWLEEKYSPSNEDDTQSPEKQDPAESPAVPDDTVSESIVGQWQRYDSVTNFFTGEDILYIYSWDFRADGTYDFYENEYIPSPDGSGEYHNGRYWLPAGFSCHEGQYELLGDSLSVYPLSGKEGSEQYAIKLHQDTLSMEDDVWTTEYQKVTKQELSTESLYGQWDQHTVYTLPDSGEQAMDQKTWVFNPDGTCFVAQNYWHASNNGTGILYDGMLWVFGSGNSYEGTYTLKGTDLTVTITIPDIDFPEVVTTVYTIELDGNTLSLYYPESGTTEEFEKFIG